jgi:hypothetical protein
VGRGWPRKGHGRAKEVAVSVLEKEENKEDGIEKWGPQQRPWQPGKGPKGGRGSSKKSPREVREGEPKGVKDEKRKERQIK